MSQEIESLNREMEQEIQRLKIETVYSSANHIDRELLHKLYSWNLKIGEAMTFEQEQTYDWGLIEPGAAVLAVIPIIETA